MSYTAVHVRSCCHTMRRCRNCARHSQWLTISRTTCISLFTHLSIGVEFLHNCQLCHYCFVTINGCQVQVCWAVWWLVEVTQIALNIKTRGAPHTQDGFETLAMTAPQNIRGFLETRPTELLQQQQQATYAGSTAHHSHMQQLNSVGAGCTCLSLLMCINVHVQVPTCCLLTFHFRSFSSWSWSMSGLKGR